MPKKKSRKPKFSVLILSFLILPLLIYIGINVTEAVKIIGNPFLLVPKYLGFIQQISSEEIKNLVLGTSGRTIGIKTPGEYILYSNNSYLQLVNANSKNEWLVITSISTREKVPLTQIERGVRPYDTHLVKGRPLCLINFPESDFYSIAFSFYNAEAYVPHTIKHSSWNKINKSNISLVPNNIFGFEKIIIAFYILQIALIVIPIGSLYSIHILRIRKLRNIMRKKKRDKYEAFWNRRKRN